MSRWHGGQGASVAEGLALVGVWTASRELGQDPGSMGVIRALCVRPLEEFAKTAVSALSSVGLGLGVSRDPVVGGPLTPPQGILVLCWLAMHPSPRTWPGALPP